MRASDALLFYTDLEIAEYRDSYGATDRRPIGALNNGIDIEPVAALRSTYDAACRPQHILFIGRLTEKSELTLLLRALAEPSLSAVTLEVVGAGPEEGQYMMLADRFGVADRVIWHGGTSNESTISSIANRCRVFVYPGAVGLSLIHAMAYGLPAVVHSDRRRHMPEIAAFKNNETGRTFAEGDPSSLAASLSSFIIDIRALNAASESSIQTVKNSFNTTTMSERFAALVRALIERRPSR